MQSATTRDFPTAATSMENLRIQAAPQAPHHAVSMNQKNALVTGAGTGIGQAIAVELARHGARVVLHYCHSESGAVEAAEQITNLGGWARTIEADFRDPTAVFELAARAIEALGGLDILVNNAGITMNLPVAEVSLDQFDTLYNVNVKAPFFLTQAVLPALIESRGCIVNTTSIHAYEGMREHSVYAGTRGAILAYTRQLAVELAPRGIRVNGVAPGCVPVERYYRTIPDFDADAAGKAIPVGRVGKPADIARVVAFLCSEAADFVVGQTLVVDGGSTSWMPFFNEDFAGRLPYVFGEEYVAGL
jgi:NAD(P)-dependent dehydrogenase (short-subunit alcohol dehydrogenase family)